MENLMAMEEPREESRQTCVACNKPWVLTKDEEDFLRRTFGANYRSPKKCIPCRKLAREAKRQ